MEIENYRWHEGVRELAESDLLHVVKTIGKAAIDGPEALVGAGRARLIIAEYCHDPFSACGNAARRILEEPATAGREAALPDGPAE